MDEQALIADLKSLTEQREQALVTVSQCDGGIQVVRHQLQRLALQQQATKEEAEKAQRESERKGRRKRREGDGGAAEGGEDEAPAVAGKTGPNGIEDAAGPVTA